MRSSPSPSRFVALGWFAVAVACSAGGDGGGLPPGTGGHAGQSGGTASAGTGGSSGSQLGTEAGAPRDDGEAGPGGDGASTATDRCGAPPSNAEVLRASDHGVVGDGVTNDGPAIAKLIALAASKASPVVIELEAGKTYRATSGTHVSNGFSWLLEGHDGITFAGHGATILLGPDVRAVWLDGVSDVAVCDLDIDFSPLPFSQGTIESIGAGTFVMTIDAGFELPPDVTAAPTAVPFFGKLKRIAEGDLVHDYPGRVEGLGGRKVRVTSLDGNQPTPAVGDRFVVPVLGVGQRGPEVIHVSASTKAFFQDVRLFSAPLFSTYISANKGPLTFSRVSIQPKPGSDRLISSWRDAFHVKDNRGPVLFDGCVVDSSQDDAFNISAHWLPVTKVVSPARVVVGRPYTAELPQVGDTLQVADMSDGTLLGKVKVTARDAASNQIDLAAPVAGLAVGTRVISLEGSNAGTVVRRARVKGTGVRLRSQVTVEDSSFDEGTVQLGVYDVEGPIPYDIQFQRSTFAHRYDTVWTLVEPASGPGSRAKASLSGIRFEGCTFGRRLNITDVTGISFIGNDFTTGPNDPWFAFTNTHGVEISETTYQGKPFADVISKTIFGIGSSPTDVMLR